MHLRNGFRAGRRQRQGSGRAVVPRHRRDRLLRPPGPRDGRAHPQHRPGRPLPRTGRAGRRRADPRLGDPAACGPSSTPSRPPQQECDRGGGDRDPRLPGDGEPGEDLDDVRRRAPRDWPATDARRRRSSSWPPRTSGPTPGPTSSCRSASAELARGHRSGAATSATSSSTSPARPATAPGCMPRCGDPGALRVGDEVEVVEVVLTEATPRAARRHRESRQPG